MSGLFDHQIPAGRPEWWVVSNGESQEIVGLALVSYSMLNMEVTRHEFVGVEHLIVAKKHRSKGAGTKIIRGLQALARKEDGLGGVNLESEHELVSYYGRFGFVERCWQPPGGQFIKLIWRKS